MGAHSFGTANASNSGYTGKWTGVQNKGLSETFYSLMLNSSYIFTNVVITNKRNEITLSETVRKLLPHFLAAL
jgi:hypothetical protein